VSKDLQLAWRCPHLTVEERVVLGSDRTSLQTTQPVGNATTVRILVNDDAAIPQGGLFAAAQLHSTVSGPFDIIENEDVFIVETPRGTNTINFNVTGVQRFTTSQVLQRLALEGFDETLAENVNNHLVFTDTSVVGPDSFVRVRGSAAAALGFGDLSGTNNRQRGARGRQIYPGWVLAKRTDDSTFRYPRFIRPIKNDPIFKVTYSVPPRRCKRCRGTFIENDTRFDATGQGIFITDENLLYQACLKILLTDVGSNPYHNWYGTTIRSRIGSKAVGNVAALLSEDVRRALARLQNVQRAQAEYQQVTAKERLYAVLGVRTRPHSQDPTTFLMDVTVQNASGEPVSLTIVFSVPEVVALLGSNGLYLGTDAAGITLEQQRKLFPAGRTLLPPEGS